MGLIDFLSRKPKPVKIRRDYDRLREKADRLPRIEKRIEMLRMLDALEPQVTMMEEHPMSTFELKKTAQYVNYNLNRIKLLMSEDKTQKELERR